MEQFIDKGLEIYEGRKLDSDYDENLYINYLFKKADDFFNNSKIDLGITIYLDATASGLQNLTFLLGCKEEEWKHLNLDGDRWCDTYFYISCIVYEEIFIELKIEGST